MRVFLQFTAHLPCDFDRPTDVIIPLDAYASVSNRLETARIDDVRFRCLEAIVDSLPPRVHRSMAAVQASLGAERACLVGYEANVLVTVLEYWTLVFSSIAAEYPDAEFCTDLEDFAAPNAMTMMQVCAAIRLHALHEEFDLDPLSNSELERNTGIGWQSLSSEVLATADRALGLLRLVGATMQHRVSRLRRRRTHADRRAGGALVIAHTNKKAQLLVQLRDAIPYEEFAVSELSPAAAGQVADTLADELRPPRGWSAWKTLESYLLRRLAALDAVQSEIEAIAAEPWTYLLTDQENDPYVRSLLARLSSSSSKCVISTPEGAQSLLGREIFSSAENFFYVDQFLVRCATSPGEAARMAAVLPSTSVITSGYLAAPPSSTRLGAKARLALIRPLVKRGPHTALINLDNEPDMGMFRTGVPSMHEKLLSYQRLLRALPDSGWDAIVTCKSSTGIAAIRRASSGLAAAVLVNVPWSNLLQWVDVVIQRDSSLGPESVAIGYPTIIWDDFGLPLASREWLEGNQPWVQHCTDEADLLLALDRIRLGIAPKEHPQPWDLIKPERQVAEWIETDRARKRVVHTD